MRQNEQGSVRMALLVRCATRTRLALTQRRLSPLTATPFFAANNARGEDTRYRIFSYRAAPIRTALLPLPSRRGTCARSRSRKQPLSATCLSSMPRTGTSVATLLKCRFSLCGSL